MIIAAGYNNMVLTALQQYFEDTDLQIRLLDLTENDALEAFEEVKNEFTCCLLDVSYSDRRFEKNLNKLKQTIAELPTVVLHNYKNGSAKTLTKKIGAQDLLSIHSDPEEIIETVKKYSTLKNIA